MQLELYFPSRDTVCRLSFILWHEPLKYQGQCWPDGSPKQDDPPVPHQNWPCLTKITVIQAPKIPLLPVSPEMPGQASFGYPRLRDSEPSQCVSSGLPTSEVPLGGNVPRIYAQQLISESEGTHILHLANKNQKALQKKCCIPIFHFGAQSCQGWLPVMLQNILGSSILYAGATYTALE